MQAYLNDMITIQKHFLNFLNEDNGSDDEYEKLKVILSNEKFRKNSECILPILSLLINISTNYHHCRNFYQKIEQILFLLKKDIIYTISYDEKKLFKLFFENKRLVLFLFREKIISCDASLMNYKLINRYFWPEFKDVVIKDRDYIFKVNKPKESPDDFEENRYLGENELYVCKIIREDLIDEFIIYVNKKNLSINTIIETSVYETNSFLEENKVKLIEYAVFFGSIQIFQYLRINGADLSQKLLLYAVHSSNAEMIHLIEEHVEITNKSIYKISYVEAIKCHHNDIARYIRDQYLYDVNPRELPNGIIYSNYEMFPNINDDFMFFSLIQYDYKLAYLYKKEKRIYDGFEINDEDYIFDSIIGDGHFGETILAEHKNTNMKFVYKTIEDDYVQFELIDKLMELKYPSLLNPIGFSWQYSPYKLSTFLLWFNYFPNGSLVKYIKNGDLLNSTQKYIVILGLAIALKHLNKNGISHHSLHPENILLDENYYPVISDFTISNNTRSAYKRKKHIDDILSYYPPETIEYKKFTSSSNVFSFAMIMYELIKGEFIRDKFKNISYMVQYTILGGKIPEIEKVNSYIHDLLMKCWSFNPNDRPSFDQIIESITNKEFFEYNFSDLDNESVKKYLYIYGDETININNKF